MNSAAAATKNAEAARTVQAFTAKLTTPPPTTSSSAKAPTPTLSITSSHTTTDKSFPHATKSVSGTATATPLALTTSATAPTLFKDLSNTNTHLTSQSSHLDESMVDERKKGDLQVQQRYDRERTIEHVLKQGKILKVCNHSVCSAPLCLVTSTTVRATTTLPVLGFTLPTPTHTFFVPPLVSRSLRCSLSCVMTFYCSCAVVTTLSLSSANSTNSFASHNCTRLLGCLVLGVLVTALFGLDRVQGSLCHC